MARTTANASASDAASLLEKDHREVEVLFVRLESAKGTGARARAFATLRDALTLHAVLEEAIFYPAVRSAQLEEAQVLVSIAEDDHRVVKGLLAELEGTTPDDPAFGSLVLSLKIAVSEHVAEEEREMFPRARRLLGSPRMRRLAERMESARAATAEKP